MNKRVFITIEGGVLQNIDVTKDLKDVKITIIDFDIRVPCNNLCGASAKIVKKTLYGDKALIHKYPSNIIGNRSTDFWKDILNKV